MYKLCSKCRWCTDKCKKESNPNYNSFRYEGAVCSTKKANSGDKVRDVTRARIKKSYWTKKLEETFGKANKD